MSDFIFGNTREVIPRLTTVVSGRGERFTCSGGNSTGLKTECVELRGVSFTITSWEDRSEMMVENGLSTVFAELDVMDRLSTKPVNPGRAVQVDSLGVLRKYLKPDGKLTYTYSERLNPQLDTIVNLLKEKPDTRQAFMSVWDACLDTKRLEKDRVPCSIGFHFLRRNDKLNLIYSMRSLEVTKCLGNDICTSTRMLEEIASRVGVEPGTVTFMVGSLHLFIDKEE